MLFDEDSRRFVPEEVFYYLCPVCGNIEKFVPEKCSICGVMGSKFIKY